jgi:glycosyltransferase involved in cell wall biosynthesis
MHILLIHQAFTALDEPGGTRHYELGRYLAGKGHHLTIIASPVSYLTGATSQPPTHPEEAYPQITLLHAYTYPALHRSFLHRLLSFFSFMVSSFWTGLKIKQVDVVWGTSPPIFQGLTAWALARLKRRPYLFEVRDLWPAFAVAVGVLRQPLLIRASSGLERFLYRHAERVMVNSPGFIEHVRAGGARQVELVPNGVNVGMFSQAESGEQLRRAWGLEGRFIALYAGAHGLSNDLGVVLEAAGRLRGRAEIVIILLGDGKDKPGLKKQAEQQGLENLVFLPPLPKSEMPQALAAADACIAILKPIELYKTVYPNKVFDYMAAGRPVILAIDGVIRELVEAANAGLFVPPGDAVALAEAICRLSDDPALGRAMGKRGQSYVAAHYSRQNQADKLEAILLELAK